MTKEKLKFKPLKNRIIVKVIGFDERTSGGLWIPTGKETFKKGEIMAVGPKSQMKVGDLIYFGTSAGKPVKLGYEDYLCMTDESVCVIEVKKSGKKALKFGLKTILNRLIVQEIPDPEKSHGGIIIGRTEDDVRKGLVVHATDKCSVDTGTMVVFNHEIGVKIKFNDTDYLVMRDDNLVAYVHGKKAKNVTQARACSPRIS